jgi:fatty acid desaturase
MTTDARVSINQRDYSLVGKNTELAISNGLANAKWYTSPVPREQMRVLLERRDGPAIRDTLLWFALLIVFGGWVTFCGVRGGLFSHSRFMGYFMLLYPTLAGTSRATAQPLRQIG